ncbi:MAG: hypothetical protein HC772_02295 [Leptolyngbyaceae cyanobacterium CRU_2_3]|nr:hypothetical protein [Leptolyngbyaceae cyanobacterium CRU_2_3]
MAKPKKTELRVVINPKIDRITKAIALLTDQNVSELVESALEDHLFRVYKDVIDKHSLDQID